ncbi:threonine--tRNA ligase [Clostridium thermosuccinogenes]|uniref:Threonine--tRNA ligase n=1 Tax=Clostridium thermosuccinogenes TaxID=84032 RepID=A0A2K2F7T4_9CLOT|nr:threonine--tRNA ligase [Pseudoclostridium thermosuccinogenes]AUS98292.1 threonine--tRNA ligase [Pseudoclostridium thermosuccinogenes]PNT94830.1 threonine--tRNA ligase [Pseudoclostridium thermosuccinogenes]PNT95473.1 threonine--tRNA ligase [Pseudoclostridium thermosuccinogenes]
MNKIEHEKLYNIRHTMAHVMAYAVKQIFGEVKFGIGPVIEDGFYYDFELPRSLVPEDLGIIEEKMRDIINNGYQVLNESISFDEARQMFNDQPYKLELINELAQNPENSGVSIYRIGEFVDLCKGPHVASLKELNLKTFKLMRVSGAYWKGDAENPMLQRIYGTAWERPEELKAYIDKIEEASKRDHRTLGTQLDLFSSSQDIGQGLVLWHPKGAMIRYLLEKFSQTAHILNGYDWVYTPHIGRAELWKTSGHLQFYKESMYNAIEIDNEEYYLKPMSCPFHIMIYNSSLRSYKDLPIRYAEYATVYRYELSGTLQGLTRVRGFTQDDAHIICTPEQVHSEVVKALKFSLYILKSFGLNNFKAYVATKPKKKSIGDDKDWNAAIESLKNAVVAAGLEYEIDEGGGAFYGPKIDLKLRDALGREWQCSTIQFDFNLPERFNMKYIGADGAKHTPMMVHRALFGSLERFFAMLIEHYNGDFPLWYAPVQIGIVPISSNHYEYCKELSKKLKTIGLRVNLDLSDDKMRAKVRRMELEKIPIVLIIGDQEVEKEGLSVRSRKEGNLGFMTLNDFLEKIKPELDMGVPKYIMD